MLKSSLISAGSDIRGTVINSVLAPGVVVEEGAVVKDSIVFTDCHIKKNAIVDLSIFDKKVTVGAGSHVGHGEGHAIANVMEPTHLYSGITLIGKGAQVPGKTTIGRNCVIDSKVDENMFLSEDIADGQSVLIQS